MEQTTNSEMAALENNLRRAQLQQVDTLKMVNILNSMGDEMPHKLDPQQTWELRKLVVELENKKVRIPEHKYPTKIELRALWSDISKAGLSLKAIIGSTAKSQAPKRHQYTDAELDAKIDAQIAEFERMCTEPDPLLTLANKLAVRPTLPTRRTKGRKGQLSAEDQALYDRNQAMK
jgi:hypothetical protein